MSGYLGGLHRTGIKQFDDVLDAIERAGDSYHHTEDWISKGYNSKTGKYDGDSEMEIINRAIDAIQDTRHVTPEERIRDEKAKMLDELVEFSFINRSISDPMILLTVHGLYEKLEQLKKDNGL